MSAESHEFQTEVTKLLDLMIHSLYSNREVFLRELISNASDAIDKRRFAGVTDGALLPDGPFGIEITADPEARTLRVSDNGVGMTRDEVVEQIGTIARSGTREFLDALEEARRKEIPPELIGQFGVGFYSSFMVALRVELVTRRAGEPGATRWSSTGEGGYEIEEATRDEAGTTVTLQLRPVGGDDALDDYTDEWVLRRVIKRYSDFVAHPIQLRKAGDEDATPEPVNSMKAIWLRDADEVSDEELSEFYKHIGHDWNEPLLHLRTRMEGNFEARALLFVPSVAPFDLYQREAGHRGLQLYVRRVFIMDDCRELLPDHLRFVRGVVDAEDLSLNVSREMLQQDRQVEVIRRHLVKKVTEELTELRTADPERYATFWKQFGAVFKEGLLIPGEKAERILDLLCVTSTHDASEPVPLADVIERMGEERDTIYYMTGTSREVLEQSPHLEAFRARGVEVIFFTDPVDEVWLQAPSEYKGKKWQSVGHGEVDLDDAADEKRAERDTAYRDLCTALRVTLQEEVKEVRLSSRLTDSPACLVLEEGDPTLQMEAMMRQAGRDVPPTLRILELNAEHPLVERLRAIHETDAADPRLAEYALLLHGQALLSEGGRPRQPAEFGRRLTRLMVDALA